MSQKKTQKQSEAATQNQLSVGDSVAKPRTEDNFTPIITGLEQASDALNQVSGLFTLLHFMGNGDLRVDPERRLDTVIGTLNAVGALGIALTDKAFGDVVDAEHELSLRQRTRTADTGKLIVPEGASPETKELAERVNQKIGLLQGKLPDEMKDLIAAHNRYDASVAPEVRTLLLNHTPA